MRLHFFEKNVQLSFFDAKISYQVCQDKLLQTLQVLKMNWICTMVKTPAFLYTV